jgi:hypothetical protein
MTNVPGPPTPVYIGGSKTKKFMGFGLGDRSTVQLSVLSHCDIMKMGLAQSRTDLNLELFSQIMENNLSDVIDM